MKKDYKPPLVIKTVPIVTREILCGSYDPEWEEILIIEDEESNFNDE